MRLELILRVILLIINVAMIEWSCIVSVLIDFLTQEFSAL